MPAMPERFFAREIQVTTAEGVKTPVAFRMGDREYKVVEVTESWQDAGYGTSETNKNWRTRHHRSYYRVKADDGNIYEMYFDRGTNLRHPEYRRWYLTQML
jgi:hypothetical protein